MDVTLTVETGRTLGTRPARRLRAEGKIPGVVYGLGRDPVSVTVPWSALRQALTTEAGLNALIDLRVDGQRDLTLVKEIQRDPVRREVTHVDFIRVDPEAEIEVDVPVVLTGEAEELDLEGGLVDHILYELTIRAKPGSIPDELEADITGLTLADPVVVGDIPLPAGVATDVDPEDPVAAGYVPRAVVEEGEEAEGEAAEGEEAEGEVPEGEEAEGEGEPGGEDEGGAGDEG
ncbi:MAG: 50S ribosomal protein L25 [Acidimicrobiia bacterium]|nr:50S ribosomal protein L25 [Acidimicrobiia bacterium]